LKEKRKRKTKKDMVGYDRERYEGCWCVSRICGRQVEIQDKE